MAIENRIQGTVNAFQRAFSRLSELVAGLSFWQFVLLAFVMLVAAGITESFWDKPAKHRVRIVDERTATDKGGAKAREKERISAEILIDQDGVSIRRKPVPYDKTSVLPVPPFPPAPQDSDKPAPVAPAAPATDTIPDAQEKQPSPQPDSKLSTKEIRIGKDLVIIRKHKPGTTGATDDAVASNEPTATDMKLSDIHISDENIKRIARQASHPPLAAITFLLVLALFVMRIFARAQQRAEKKADAAQAVAERETLQRQVVEARLQLLQAQVEPHFLFNTLAAVEHLIETAPARAAQMQNHLIDYLRSALPRMRQQSATLGQEVELCVSYLKIMQMRMEERLQYSVTVPSGLTSAAFPPMMLQSLVENSIRHGLEPKPEGGSINLAAEVRDGRLCVTVADTGLGFSSNARTGIGLANVRERLQQLFGAIATLTIEPNQPSGTRATIAVPYAVA